MNQAHSTLAQPTAQPARQATTLPVENFASSLRTVAMALLVDRAISA
ncbi:hypothetical protein [Paraburkholderia sp. GAS334]|jgi:hypothetical protein